MHEQLTEYREKRHFDRTSEPMGMGRQTPDEPQTKLAFAVQYHIARRVHYDLRLEWQGVLLSWAVPKGPSCNPRDKRLAVKVEDHPLEYGDFEGTIPKGEYGGGTVMLWDTGYFVPQPKYDFAEGLQKGSLKIELHGSRLKGKWALVRMQEKEGERGDNWLFIKEKDEYAQSSDGISGYNTGIKSGRTIEEIAREEDPTNRRNPMGRVDVQLAKFTDGIPGGNDWLYEIKYDGYRITAFTEGGKTRLMTRGGKDYTDKFARVARSLDAFSDGRAMVLDGEMVICDSSGRPDFQALQQYVKKPDGKALVYMAFDLLALDGADLRDLPLIERKEKLAALLQNAPDSICLSRHVVGNGQAFFEAAQKLGLEGIVGKRADSLYRGDRSGDWIKLKCYRRQEFVIGGYTQSDKKTSGVSALLLGVYDGKSLVYMGRAGTGMSLRGSQEMEQTLQAMLCENAPFENAPKARGHETFFWVQPRLVAEVQYAEITHEQLLRQASFKGLRDDKDPKEVTMEGLEGIQKTAAVPPVIEAKKTVKKGEATVCGVKITNPDKVVFSSPEVKKIDVVRYYEAVAGRMLAYAAGRVLSVVRCHKGVSSACFYKKHPVGQGAGVSVISIPNSEGECADYFYIDGVQGLLSEAQLGSLEFHIWGSTAQKLEKPDMMVFDLDPDEGLGLENVRQGVRDLKQVLDALSLQSFLKTSGGKGYHVVVPFRPTVGWDAFHDFAKRIAKVMEAQWPDRYTSNIRKVKRQGKIFIDWARNGRGATSVAPYSLRARPGALVSMPIAWDELDRVTPSGIDMFEALERIKKADPWETYFSAEQELKL